MDTYMTKRRTINSGLPIAPFFLFPILFTPTFYLSPRLMCNCPTLMPQTTVLTSEPQNMFRSTPQLDLSNVALSTGPRGARLDRLGEIRAVSSATG
jgi:hypothetical protein